LEGAGAAYIPWTIPRIAGFCTLDPSLTLRVVIGRVSVLMESEAMKSNQASRKAQLQHPGVGRCGLPATAGLGGLIQEIDERRKPQRFSPAGNDRAMLVRRR
jgi:hypothetical protein